MPVTILKKIPVLAWRYNVANLDARYLLKASNLSDLASASTARTNMGVAIGSDVQAYDADLTAIAALSSADSNIIVGSAGGWIAESGATARTSLGVAIGSDVQAYDATLAAWAAYNTNGILTQTAGDTFTGRTITGTGNQITVSNGDGVSGNPTLSTPQDIHTSATPEFDGVTIGSAAGIDCNPGSDADTDIFTVGVTGSPKLWWDETWDTFGFTNDVDLAGNRLNFHAKAPSGSSAAKIYWAEADRIDFGWTAIGGGQMEFYSNDHGSKPGDFRVVYGGGAFGDYMMIHYNGSVWNRRFVIDKDGKTTINKLAVAAAGQLDVDQSSSTGAIPVLRLDQADVSEEFVRFIGTSADGVLTQSIVEEGDQASETVAGWLKVYVQDDGDQLADQAYYIPVYTLSA